MAQGLVFMDPMGADLMNSIFASSEPELLRGVDEGGMTPYLTLV
jgi:hypothetical protein